MYKAEASIWKNTNPIGTSLYSCCGGAPPVLCNDDNVTVGIDLFTSNCLLCTRSPDSNKRGSQAITITRCV